MKRIARKEMKDFFKKIYKCRPMSHRNVIKLKVETEESTSFCLLLREIFFIRETPCIFTGCFSYIQKVDEIAFEKFKKLTPNPLTNFPK